MPERCDFSIFEADVFPNLFESNIIFMLPLSVTKGTCEHFVPLVPPRQPLCSPEPLGFVSRPGDLCAPHASLLDNRGRNKSSVTSLLEGTLSR